MVTTEPRPSYLRNCCWCDQYIPEEDEDQVCPSNSGDKHVPQMFGRDMFEKEGRNEH